MSGSQCLGDIKLGSSARLVCQDSIRSTGSIAAQTAEHRVIEDQRTRGRLQVGVQCLLQYLNSDRPIGLVEGAAIGGSTWGARKGTIKVPDHRSPGEASDASGISRGLKIDRSASSESPLEDWFP